jgi:hypothetical protein
MNKIIIFAPVIIGGIYLFYFQKNKSINISTPNLNEKFTPLQLNQERLNSYNIPSIYNNVVKCKFSRFLSNNYYDMINGFSQ